MPLFKRGARHGESSGSVAWAIVGLGNPGERYEKTRHNAGALVVADLLGRTGGSLKRHKSGCLISETNLGGSRVVLARPTTYMNESGRPVRALTDWYRVPPERLIVVHDEIDIAFGRVVIKEGGGTAGHNGLASIVSHLGTKDFVRIRVGVGRPRGSSDAAGHVLDRFSGAERKQLPELLSRAADAVEAIVADGLDRAMNEFNTRDA